MAQMSIAYFLIIAPLSSSHIGVVGYSPAGTCGWQRARRFELAIASNWSVCPEIVARVVAQQKWRRLFGGRKRCAGGVVYSTSITTTLLTQWTLLAAREAIPCVANQPWDLLPQSSPNRTPSSPYPITHIIVPSPAHDVDKKCSI